MEFKPNPRKYIEPLPTAQNNRYKWQTLEQEDAYDGASALPKNQFFPPTTPKTTGNYYHPIGSAQYSDKVSKISSFGGETLGSAMASGTRFQADHHLRQTLKECNGGEKFGQFPTKWDKDINRSDGF